MVCTTSCIISGAFIVAMMYVMLTVDKKALMGQYSNLLSDQKKKIYKNIIIERRNIYFRGFVLGLGLALAVSMYLKETDYTKMETLSFIGAISFTVNYFYYMLHPKSDYMVNYLDTKEEKTAWLKIYRTMQSQYHTGFVLGLIGMIAAANSFL